MIYSCSKSGKFSEIWSRYICIFQKDYLSLPSPKQVDLDGTEWPGVQIDLLLCRGDHVIDVCEMKYCQSEFVLTEKYEQHLRERNATFAHFTKAKEALHTVLITTYGLKQNLYSGSINAVVTMENLFTPSS
jgi:hypothetical protein